MTSCYRCGRSKSSVTDALEQLAWTSERSRDGAVQWLCHVCSKAHARDIEGKLPAEYW